MEAKKSLRSSNDPLAEMRVLVTNQIDSSLFSDIESVGISIDIHPFIHTKSSFEEKNLLEHVREFNPQVIAISSKNALSSLGLVKDLLCDFFTVCVTSRKIAAETETMGIKAFISGESNSESLAEMLVDKFSDKRILHLCGNLRKDELRHYLKEKGLEAESHVVYETTFAQPEINPGIYNLVVFNSYSAIDSFYRKYSLNTKQTAITIGPKTTEYLKQFFDGVIHTSGETNIETLIKDIQLLNESN